VEVFGVPERPLGVIAVGIEECPMVRFAGVSKDLGEALDLGFIAHARISHAAMSRCQG
jgi:hypothetical protein